MRFGNPKEPHHHLREPELERSVPFPEGNVERVGDRVTVEFLGDPGCRPGFLTLTASDFPISPSLNLHVLNMSSGASEPQLNSGSSPFLAV